MSVFGKAPTAQESFVPTVVDPSKYAVVCEGRKKFMIAAAGIFACTFGLLGTPSRIARKSSLRLFKNHCVGRVLDLTPKIGDARSVELYESTKAIRVDFLVTERVVDDGSYTFDDSITEAAQATRRRDMTLEHMCYHDPAWVASPVSYGTVSKFETQLATFQPYDTVIVRYGLCNLDNEEAAHAIEEGVNLLKVGGRLVLVEVGACHVNWINNLALSFHKHLSTSMYLTRNYEKEKWMQRPDLKMVHCDARLLGCHQSIAWQKMQC